MEYKTIMGFVLNCKAQEAVIEPGDLGLSGSLSVCPRVVSIKENHNFTRIPVRICNISARAIKIEPRSQLR